jgi:hypothetical protein
MAKRGKQINAGRNLGSIWIAFYPVWELVRVRARPADFCLHQMPFTISQSVPGIFPLVRVMGVSQPMAALARYAIMQCAK